jgi:hypothetical protein
MRWLISEEYCDVVVYQRGQSLFRDFLSRNRRREANPEEEILRVRTSPGKGGAEVC